jgi:peptidylprolyl isomerase
MNFVDAINRGEPPADPTRILQASIASDNRPAPVSAPAPAALVPAPAVGATPPR